MSERFEEQSVSDLLHELLAVQYQQLMYWHGYFRMHKIKSMNEEGQFKSYYELYMHHKKQCRKREGER